MVKSLKERMAEKREAREASEPPTATTARLEPTPCITCRAPVTDPPYCNACRAVRAQMTIARPKPEPPKEKKPVSTSGATNHMVKSIESPKSEKLSIEPERIKAIRLKHGMTQAEFGDHLNVSNPTISLWENGKTNPSPIFIEQILKLEKQEPAIVEPISKQDEPPATATVAGEEPTPAMAEEPVKVVPTIEELNRRLVEAQDKVARIAVPEYPTDPSELAQQISKRPSATVNLQANVTTHVTTADRPISLRDDFDAFRLLVRTFGIDTADRIVDLLRA